MTKTHWRASDSSATCAIPRNGRRRLAPLMTSNPAYVTCERCKKIFAGEIAAKRNAQLDAQERDTLQSTASAKADRQREQARVDGEQHMQYVDATLDAARARIDAAKAERDAKISELLDEECTLRRLVQDREKLTSIHKQNAFRNGRVHRSALKAYYASKDLLALEVAKLNSVRGQLCVLSPVGTYAIRRADESIAFVTIP